MTPGTLALPRFLARLPADRLFVVVTRATALVAIVLVLSMLSPHFFTFQNLMNVLRQASLQFILSAGLTLVILAGGIDLSVGAVLGLSACLGASLIVSGHMELGIAAALAAGLACGLANGMLVTKLRIPAFIATYGMLWIAHGLTYVFMKGEVIHGFDKSFRFIGAGYVGPIPAPVVAAAILVGLLYVVLHHTRLGRGIYAIGGNPVAARLSGMPVSRYLITVMRLAACSRRSPAWSSSRASTPPIPAPARSCCSPRSPRCASAARRSSAGKAGSAAPSSDRLSSRS